MAKRSPILGYNHNVRYRGVIFHVQTEDSGVLSPHLFTHLFHEGVIVSTRKLVYDAGASPEAIKALMQAQHKAVLKDLNKGVFDQKIDQYLAGTPGLEPRSGAAAAAEAKAAAPGGPAGATVAGLDSDDSSDEPSPRRRVPRDTMVDEKPTPSSDLGKGVEEPPSVQHAASPNAASPTVEQPPTLQPSRPAQPSVEPSRRSSDSDPAEIYAPAPPAVEPPPAAHSLASGQYSLKRPTTPAPSASASSSTTVRGIDPPPHPRGNAVPSGRVHAITEAPPRGSAAPSGRAAITEPPSRGSPGGGAMTESPTRGSAASPGNAVSDPWKTGTKDAGRANEPAPNRPITPPPGTLRNPTVNPPLAIPRTATLPNRAALSQPPPTPPAAAKAANTTLPRMAAAPSQVRPPTAGSNVVMTRPAVIVGAPSGANNRQRPAEEPARPFGQALISEKSLDEVIHAYLSEDGDEL